MNSGLSIKRLTAFAVVFVLASGLGLPGSSLIPENSGLTSIIDDLGSDAWADDNNKKKKVPTIVVTAPRVYPVGIGGHQIYGYPIPMQFTEAERQEQRNAACRAAVRVAQAAGAHLTSAGGTIASGLTCSKIKQSKDKKANLAKGLACGLAVGAAITQCLLADVTALE